MGDTDFEEQLRLQELEKQDVFKTNCTVDTYTDKDGTVYEWDHKQKAYVPKIDDDFIAQYQMNYGTYANSGNTESSEQSEKPAASTDSQLSAEDSAENAKQWKEYFEYCKNYYEQQRQNSDGKDAADENDASYNYYYYYYQQYCQQQQQQQVEDQTTADAVPKQEQQSSTSESNQTSEKSKTPLNPPGKRTTEDLGWFDVEDKHNMNVYVSNLPLDITDEEFTEFMKKCGLIMFDPKKRTPKIKLYKDENGQPKGDGLCCYIKPESVSLAIQILDGYDLRGKKVKVELAKFEMKGNFDPAKKKRKLTNKEKKKFKEKQEKLFDWRPEPLRGARFKREKTVVLQNMFEPKEFDDEPTLLQELREDVRTECSKFGDVRKVTIYDRNTNGVITVTFREPEEADECIAALHGRWFAQKRITAETWDGKTKYDVVESEEERQKRLSKWTDFLMAGENKTDITGEDEIPSTSEKDPLVTSVAKPDDAEVSTLKNTQGISDAAVDASSSSPPPFASQISNLPSAPPAAAAASSTLKSSSEEEKSKTESSE